jgi:methyltransferase (TIGR00027 family)
MTPVGLTSRWVAASRARETERSDHLFADPYARALAGEEGFTLLRKTHAARSGQPSDEPDPYLSIRTRFFDDALIRAVADPALDQVVLLAAGMDARAFRLNWPVGVTLYELDREEVFAWKEPVLRTLGAQPACTRRLVTADLERDWALPLCRAGFDASRSAVFLVEGLLAYLDEPAVTGLLDRLKGVARPGSWLGTDMVDPSLLASPYLKPFLDELDRLGCPWRFGTSEPEGLLARNGWVASVVMPGESSAHHGRWPYPVAPRSTPGLPRSYLVTARRVEDSAELRTASDRIG